MRRKILFVITKSSWGGAQRYVYDLSTHLPPEQFEVAVAAGGNGLLFERLTNASIRAIRLTGLQRDIAIRKEVAVLWELVRLFMREQPDIVHLNSSKIGGLGAIAARIAAIAIRKKIRVAFTVHGWGFYEDRPLAGRAAIFLASWFSTLLHHAVITIDTADFRAAQRFIPARKLHLIFNGIGEEDFLARADARAFFSHTIGRPIANNTFLIGAIAELTPNKGLSYLISALETLNQIGLNYGGSTSIILHTIIIGEGEERGALEAQIKKCGLEKTVALLGFNPDARTALAGLDIFVLPSLKEGLPYAVMEAMVVGLPVVATRVGGLPDLITDGKDGVLVAPKNLAMLTNALLTLARDPDRRARLGERAQEKVKTRFSFHAMLDATLKLYRDL